jgi:replicative DNA helicase
MGRDMVTRVSTIIKPDDMYSPAHAVIYSAILEAHKKGLVPESLVVAQALKDAGKIDAAGGVAYLTSVINAAPGTANVAHYADIVARKARLRKLISACTEVAVRARHDHGDDDKFIADAGAKVHEICRTSTNTCMVDSKDALRSVFLEIQSANARGSELVGLTTGITDLDAVMKGLRNKSLVMCAGRPGSGKTALLLNLACTTVLNGNGALFFSCEMTQSQIMQRLISQVANVDCGLIELGALNKEQWASVTAAVGRLANLPFKIDDTPDLTASQIRQRILAGIREGFIQKRPVKAIFLDYIQRVRVDDADRRAPRYEQLARIVESIKATAKEIDLPIVTAAQLRRPPDGKAGLRPDLSSLRESGDLEQASDQVIAIWRDKSEAELILLKNRFGKDCTVKVRWQPEYTKFSGL